MAYFKRDRFSGVAPGVAPRLLADTFGQIAENVDLESGRLVSIKENSDISVTPSTNSDGKLYFDESGTHIKNLYFYEDQHWLQFFEEHVNVVPGPIPADSTNRLYVTGWLDSPSGNPGVPRVLTEDKILNASSALSMYPKNGGFRLGVPAPEQTPVTTKSSNTLSTTQTPNDVSYVYTFVTALGEEGPPSPASVVIELTDKDSSGSDLTVSVTTPSFPTTGAYANARNFGSGAKKRLYRSNTGSTNTTFQFVTEADYTATAITDDKDAAELGEVLPSGDWIGPPDDNATLYPTGPLSGLIPLAQGVMAGFTGKRLCLSEPFLPHAWPISYRITLEENIVAIANTANGVVALTNGHAYFVTGTDPSAMTAVRTDFAQACVNRNSLVDMGDYILYAGPDGLCAVEGTTGQVVTKGLISVAQWNADFFPTTLKAFYHEGTYVAFYTDTSTSPDTHAGWVYDPRGDDASLTTFTTSGTVYGGHTVSKEGALYINIDDRLRKFKGGTTDKTLKFKSKKFVTSSPVSMSWVSVHANTYPATVKVYADGALISNYTVSKNSVNNFTQVTTVPSGISDATIYEPIMRLPATVGLEWEIEVEGTDINEFCLAQSIDEIRGT